MKAFGLPLALLLMTSCGSLGKLTRRQPKLDPSQAQVVFNPSSDPFAISKPTLKLPGAAAPGAPAGAAPPENGASGTAAAPGSLYDFSTAFQNPEQSRLAHWRHSGVDAIAEARRRSLPLLILFTHQSIAAAQEMDSALSSSPELTGETMRFIPLHLDYSDKATADSDYYKTLLARYKPRGFPVLVLALPDGTELTRQTGCTKDWRGQMKHWLDDAADRARSGLAAHRRRLAPYKFRMWKNSDGQEIFARLDSQDANQLVFTNEWGGAIHTFLNRLSKADQEKIASNQL